MFAGLAMKGGQIEVYEDGQILRDLVYIDDVVDALVRCIGQPPAGERILDVGSGVATTVLDLGTMISEMLGSPTPEITGNFRDGDVRAAWADVTVTTDQIGYLPSVTLQEGIGRLLEWMKDQIDVT
jgi:dTDP-L-rhamnose 4-epimerase